MVRKQRLQLGDILAVELERNQQPAPLLPSSDVSPTVTKSSLAIDQIDFPAWQPRRYFDQQKLEQLTSDIRTRGVQSAIWVRPKENGRYELIAGERRLRASIAAGLKEIPVDVKYLSDSEALDYALVENLQREDLNPIEETEGYLRLLAQRLETSTEEIISLLYRMKNEAEGAVRDNVVPRETIAAIEAIFALIGTISWQSFLKHRMPLLKLPNDVLEVLRQGQLAYTKAQAIARVRDDLQREALLKKAIEENLSLSQIRQLATEGKITPVPPELPRKLASLTRRSQKSKAWQDPGKQKRLQVLLEELELLLMDNSS